VLTPARVAPFVLVLTVAALPLAAASAQQAVWNLEDQASDAHPWAAWAIQQLPAGDPHKDGSGSSSGSDGSGSSGSGSGSGASNPADDASHDAQPFVVLAVTTVTGAAGKAMGLVPSDPLGLVGDQLTPVRDAADALPTIVFGPPQEQVDAPAPAAATIQAAPQAPLPIIVAAGAATAAAAVVVLWLAGSSGSLGAGAAGAGTGGKLAGTDLRRLLPFASPLFTRFEKDTVLGHPKREALYAMILQDPGVSLQSLCDATGLSRTAVTHHLRLMELQHLIVSKRMGRSRHYYENGGRFGRDQKDAYAVLQNPRSKQVAQFVKDNPGAIQKAVCAAVGVQASVAHWHLRRLLEAQIVEAVRHGRTVSYFPGAGLKGLEPTAAATAAAAPAAPAPAPVVAVAALRPLTA